jgi:hypothetical protein
MMMRARARRCVFHPWRASSADRRASEAAMNLSSLSQRVIMVLLHSCTAAVLESNLEKT